MKTKVIILSTLIFIVSILITVKSEAHCEIPCGIFEDSIRIELIAEHIVTIEKSMKQIIELSKEESVNYNQMVRWIWNKEEHANKIQDIVSQYFLNQRIKTTDKNEPKAYSIYTNQLVLLHQLIIYSMKAKQTTDLEYINKLNETLNEFSDLYFHKHSH